MGNISEFATYWGQKNEVANEVANAWREINEVQIAWRNMHEGALARGT